MTCLLAPLPPTVVITWPTLLGSPSAGGGEGRQSRASRQVGSGWDGRQHGTAVVKCRAQLSCNWVTTVLLGFCHAFHSIETSRVAAQELPSTRRASTQRVTFSWRPTSCTNSLCLCALLQRAGSVLLQLNLHLLHDARAPAATGACGSACFLTASYSWACPATCL